MTTTTDELKDENFNLTFRNLFYRARPRLFSGEKGSKYILKGICGEFCGSELTAVIGLSGSGKSSLLDCLTSFRVKNVSGSIEVNNQRIDIRKISSYIMQEQTLHEMLTVSETLTLSLNFKNSSYLSEKEKRTKVQGILSNLNFSDKRDSLVQNLSGGQKKRLSIAVELVHDPKILFLDEPTTGLDHVSATHCIYLLKKLASEGKTVILTVHQPSALILNMFDHIYALANGKCIYQGTGKNIVPFLSELDLVCPSTYNPADFLLEIANNDYGELNHTLSQHIRNGSNNIFSDHVSPTQQIIKSTQTNNTKNKIEQSMSFIWQIIYLMQRTFLITKRSKTSFHLRLGIHLILGIIFGHIYQNVGNDGAAALNNFKYMMVTVIFQLFMGYYSHVTTFPLEFAIIKREHFNGWYSTISYYTAFVLFDLPITILCCTSYVTITYLMTDQPAEIQRFALFLGFSLCTALTAHAMGIVMTALLSIKFATVLGCFFLMPLFMFSSALIISSDIPPMFQIFFDSNFLDYEIKGVMTSIFGLNRTKLRCDEIYCHLGTPKKLLRDFGMEVDLTEAFRVIFFYFLAFRILGYFLIRYRLKNWH